MIYYQTKLYYLLAIISCLGLTRRIVDYFKEYFSQGFAILVALTVILHPLSIDAFLGPNIFSGVIAFWLLLESLFLHRSGKTAWAIPVAVLAGVFNVSYTLMPLYFFYKSAFESRKKYFIPALIYILLLGFYFYKLTLLTSHNPLSFITYHIQSIVFPFMMNFFSPSLIPFNFAQTLASAFLLILVVWREEKNKLSRSYWFLIFLPLVGTLIHQWTDSYKFWDEVVYSSSTYLSITFAFIFMMAIHLPRKLFVAYSILTLVFSFFWGNQWNPMSKMMKNSFDSLPENYKEMKLVKRTLAWQLLNEERLIEGKKALGELVNEYPKDNELKKDLESIK